MSPKRPSMKAIMKIKRLQSEILSAPQPEKKVVVKSDPSIVEEIIPLSKDKNKIRKYKIGRFLGKGGFTKCYEFIYQDNNKIFVAKVIDKSSLKTDRQRQKLITEIKIHKSCHYPNTVAFEPNFEDAENVYILLDFVKIKL